jgi:hypothetical protein
MAHQLTCPCGEFIARKDQAFIGAVRAHLSDKHPQLSYTDEAIYLVADEIPDRLIPEE